MERALVMLLVCLLSASLVDAQPMDGEEELDGPDFLKAFVARRGGAMRLYREMPPHPGKDKPRKTGQIEISFGRIREAVNDTDDMPRPQRPPRSPRPGLEDPDDIDFDVRREMDKNLQRDGGSSVEIKGDCLVLKSPLKEVNDSVFTLTVCAIKDNGSLTMDDEDTEVLGGHLKFSVQLDNWPWSSDGQFIDIDIVMKLPGGRRVRKDDEQMGGPGMGGPGMGRPGMGPRRPDKFDLGSNALIYFSRKVRTDDTWRDMPDGFPSPPKKRGGHDVITLRFPRFNETVFYDPTVSVTYEQAIEDGGNTLGGKALRASFAALSAGLLLFLAVFKLVL